MGDRQGRPGEELRVPLEQAIALRFLHLNDFVDELSANVSAGGMFLRTGNPHPVGSIFEFEFRLGDDFTLIEGKAQVVWVRRRPDGDRPAGMGVRFVELDDESRRVVLRMVAEHAGRGGDPFELEDGGRSEAAAGAKDGSAEPAVAASATAEDELDAKPPPRDAAPAGPVTAADDPTDNATGASAPAPTEPGPSPELPGAAADPPTDSRGGRRRRAGLAWLLAAAALAVATLLWLEPAPGIPEATSPAAASDAAPIPAAPPAPTLAAAEAEESEPAAPIPPKPLDEVLAAVQSWAASWSEQRPDEYLVHYSADFRPADGSARHRWEQLRRSRILAPDWIEVGLAFLEPELLDPRTARVRFVQSYESDTYRDVVRKQIELKREQDGWKIVGEVVTP